MTYKNTTNNSYQATAQEFAQNVANLVPLESIEKFIQLLPHHAKILDVYRNTFKIWILDCAKASGFNHRKLPYIFNIRQFAMIKSRELSRCPKPNFECVSV